MLQATAGATNGVYNAERHLVDMSRMETVSIEQGCVDYDAILGIDLLSSCMIEFRIPGDDLAAFQGQLPRVHRRDEIESVRTAWYQHILQRNLFNKPLSPWELGDQLFSFGYEGHVLSEYERDFLLPQMIFQELVDHNEVFTTAIAILSYRERRYAASLPPPKLSEIMEKTRELNKHPSQTLEHLPGTLYQPMLSDDREIFTYAVAKMQINDSYLSIIRKGIPHDLVKKFQAALKRDGIWNKEINMISLGKTLVNMYKEERGAHNNKMFIALLTTVAHVNFCSFVELLFTFYLEEKIYRSS